MKARACVALAVIALAVNFAVAVPYETRLEDEDSKLTVVGTRHTYSAIYN
jgi:hypothetical protein